MDWLSALVIYISGISTGCCICIVLDWVGK